MLTRRVIPCLDVRDGRVVKGVRFQDLRDAGDPPAAAAAYAAQGADELVMLDVSATPDGRKTATETVRALRRVLSIPLTVGGGVRSTADASALLDAGADKVALNTAAVEQPTIISDVAEQFGRQCTVIAIDAAREAMSSAHPTFVVVTHSGTTRTGRDVRDWTRDLTERGAGEILLTSWDRDGTRSGYDLDLIRTVRAVTDIPIIASGGAASAQHMADALLAGADAVLAASIFHDQEMTVGAIKQELAAAGVEVRQ